MGQHNIQQHLHYPKEDNIKNSKKLTTRSGSSVVDNQYTKAKIFAKVGKKTDMFLGFSTVAGERGIL